VRPARVAGDGSLRGRLRRPPVARDN